MKLVQIDTSKPIIVPASGSPNGKQIKIAPTATPGTELHKAVEGTDSWDVVTVEACNTSGAAVVLTVEFGGVAVDDQIKVSITNSAAPVVVVNQRWINNGLVIRAFAATTNVINVYVSVMRYSSGS